MMRLCMIVSHGKTDSGEYDPGAVYRNYQEFQLVREIAKIAAGRLKRLFHAECTLLNYNADCTPAERTAVSQDQRYDLTAEIHLNGENPEKSGTAVYYSPGDSVGKQFAEQISSEISASFHIPNQGAEIQRDLSPSALRIRTCSLTADHDKINNLYGLLTAGEAIASGIAKCAAFSEAL